MRYWSHGSWRDSDADRCVVSSNLNLEYETPLNTWARSEDRVDLHARLAANYQLPSNGGIINKYDSMYPRSTGQRTSIAVHARSEAPSTTASDNVPRLTRGNSNASSIGSADTDIASSFLDGMPTLESINGVLQVPVPAHPHADLICPFQILDCEEPFNDVWEWKTHVFSHFRGHPCPVTATCFLCESTFDQSEDDHPARAWNEMLSHMAAVHFRGLGQRLATVRTDFALMRWMYNRRIITTAQFTRTQSAPVPTMLLGSPSDILNLPAAPSPPPPPPSASVPGGHDAVYTVQASSRRERRTRSNRRG